MDWNSNSNNDNKTYYNFSLAGVAPWIERQPPNQKVASLIPNQGTCLGWGQLSSWGHARGNWFMYLSYIDVSPSPPL